MAKKQPRAPAEKPGVAAPVIVDSEGNEVRPERLADGSTAWPGYLRYVRPGEFLLGVPARDITFEEWLALREDLQARAQALNLFEFQAGPMPAPAASESPAQEV